MTARAVFEKNCHEALTKYKQAVAEGTYLKTADNTLVDAVLKAADRYALDAFTVRNRAYRGVPAAITSPEAAAARIRAREAAL